MSKAVARGQQWGTRTASFSTRAAANGVNLLNWDMVPEDMTPEQEREALVAHLKRLQDIRLVAKANREALCTADFISLGKAIADTIERIKAIRPKRRSGQGIQDCIIEILRPKFSVGEWRSILDQANGMLRGIETDDGDDRK